MHLRSYLSLVVALIANALFAQQFQIMPGHSGEPCGFDPIHRQLMESDPVYREKVLHFEHEAMMLDGTFERSLSTYKIPVVVHVMETGNDMTNITDDRIRDAIRALNERFRKVAGTAGAGNGVDVGIEFALAVRDPNGNCTSGITRRNMTGNATYMSSGVFRGSAGISEASLKALDVWDQTEYYNIWVVSEIDGNDGGNGIQGFALFSTSHGSTLDGCVLLAKAMRDPANTTLTHELGHTLNVYHTFEGDNNGASCPANATCNAQGDAVCDTPPHRRSNSDCLSAGTNSCDANSSNSLFVFNYMDYSSCGNMFSSGQAARMVLALTTDRASFLAVNGNMALVPPGAPTIDIRPSANVLCGTGQSVTLYNNSTCLPNTFISDSEFPAITYSWTLTNGVNTYNSAAPNPTFTLASTGTYNATLSVTTALGTYNQTENGAVVVTSAPVGVCTPTSLNPTANYGITVSRVRFHTFDNGTDMLANGVYQNFTCTKNTVVMRNGSYPLNITVNGSSTNGPGSFEAYIDYNNNGVFGDAGELVGSGSSATTGGLYSTTVTIPNTATQNTLLRMRVYCDADGISTAERTCGSALLVADVEDYGVYVSTAAAAVSIAAAPGTTISYGTNVTFTPTPTNGGGTPTYQWFLNGVLVSTGSTYGSTTLLPGDQVYCRMFSNLAGVQASPATSNVLTMIVTGPPRSDLSASARSACAGGSISFSDLSLLSPTAWNWSFPGGTPSSSTAQNPTVTYASAGTYAVTLTASNGLGTGTTMSRTGYITVYTAPAAGCSVTRAMTPAGEIGIMSVTVGDINSSSANNDAVMVNNTCTQVTTLAANTTYNIRVGVSTINDQWVRVYIDYNRDGDFVDLNEQIFSPANGKGFRSGTFTTPAAPPSTGQLLRMRVISDFVNTGAGPCTTPLDYGQVEEYGVVFNTIANTAPVLNAIASPVLAVQTEDAAAPSGAVGTLVSTLVDFATPSGQMDNVTDPDAGALTGIAIIAADAANGTWHYSTNNGTNWTALGTPSSVSARLLAADANSRLYFQPTANFNGTVASAITFRAWDQTSGTNGSTGDASTNGGTTAFSTATDVASLTVTAVNDAPILNATPSPALTAVLEDATAPSGAIGTLVSALVDFAIPSGQLDNVTDVDAGAFLGIAITAADATNGIWFYSTSNGANWSALGTPSVSIARLLAADANTRIYFQPNTNFSGVLSSAITFRAWDQTAGSNGSTASTTTSGGTTAFSLSTDVASIAVTAVNDAPVADVPGTQTTDQGVPLTFSVVNGNVISVNDVDAGGGILSITLTATNGTLTLVSTIGLSFTVGDGTNDAAMTFTANLNGLNGAMNGMVFMPTPGYTGVASVSIAADDQGNTGTGGALNDDAQVLINVVPTSVLLNVHAILDGAYDTGTGLMRDVLRTLPDFPVQQPYGNAPWSHAGSEVVSAGVLAVSGNNAVVDWVLVQLRPAGDVTAVAAEVAGLLQRDGDVVAADGTSPLAFDVAPASYHIVVLHRNHLGAMTNMSVSLSASAAAVDLASVSTTTFGTEARRSVGGVMALWCGDALSDGELRYTGEDNDRDPMLQAIGGAVPTNTITGYRMEDVNLDGLVMYTGDGNDRDRVLQNIGGVVPTNVRFEQLP